MESIKQDYPWTELPLIVSAPMRLIALSKLTSEVSNAHGLGFLGIGSDASTMAEELEKTKASLTLDYHGDVLPFGVGFLVWAGEKLLNDALPLIESYKPAAIWLFAPKDNNTLPRWSTEVRRVTNGRTKIWIQVGTVADAKHVVSECQPDVLVVQATDAGGHGLNQGAGLIPLLPEIDDAVTALCSSTGTKRPTFIAAGGIMDGRGCAAALSLGASGVTLGTRYLISPEANIAKGYRDAVLNASDGGVTTARGKLYDTLRGTTDWPDHYGGRGVLNETWRDHSKGMSIEENKRLYDEALKKGDDGWGSDARLTTYAGTGVGLANEIKGAREVTEEVRKDALRVLKQVSGNF